MSICRLAAALLATLLLAAPAASAADSAVVLLYHRFGDARVPSANTRLEQLDAHLAELQAGGFAVLPLPEILAALKDGRPLPDKAVAITVDEGGAGLLAEAWPRLRKAGLPFTLFVAPDEVDRGGADTLKWAQLRELAAEGVTIGSLAQGRRGQVAADLERARGRFEKELGRAPELLAWSLGEAGAEAMAEARRLGYATAFGQHSGVLWTGAEPLFLPRFAMNETYGEPERFRLAVRALPLPAVDVTPADPLLKTNPPHFGFTLAGGPAAAEGVACFASHEGRLRVEQLGPRVEVRMAKPLPAGRSRINCTLPTLEGRWRWFGWQFWVN